MNWHTVDPDILKALHETISFHEALRRIGYLPKDIFVQVAPDRARAGKLSAFTLLRVRGLAEVNFTSGQFNTEAEAEEFERVWPKFVEHWNGDVMLAEDRRKIYESSFVVKNNFGLVSTLLRKGHMVAELDAASLGRWFNA